ncbi:hypothetical protein ACFELO_10840 [Oceanicaulis sp. LC35]|uniref:hypothetical protein n=1 Tax=Oceanicaulis sp. LC35 TaxID=3349635 RepID=UPI003F87A612
MSDNTYESGADDGRASEFASGQSTSGVYESEREKLTREELGLVLEDQRVIESRERFETSLQVLAGWTSWSLVGLAVFVLGVLCDVFAVTPALFERYLGCAGTECGAIASVSLASLTNWGVSLLGALLAGLGLFKLRFQRILAVRRSYSEMMQRFRQRDALRPVFIGSGRVQLALTGEGLQLIGSGRRLVLDWRAFDGNDLLYDPAYNRTLPEAYANKSELRPYELEEFLTAPDLPDSLKAFREEAIVWAKSNDSLCLPLRQQIGDRTAASQAEPTGAGQADVEHIRDYLLLPKRVFRDTISGLDWNRAVPAILYMIFSRDNSVDGPRREREADIRR